MIAKIRDLSLYRPNVGMAVFSPRGLVFLGRRLGAHGPYHWQMPQGGMDKGETAREAAFRELEEEVGLPPSAVELLSETEDWLVYDFPDDDVRSSTRPYLGQKQKWFAFRLIGSDADINIRTKHPEFDDWRWADLTGAPALVIPFKRAVYEEVARRFAPFARP